MSTREPNFFESLPGNDPSWERALAIASAQLQVPSHVWNLFRAAWNDTITQDEFLRVLGFSRLNPRCLLHAANLYTEAEAPDASCLVQALELLGLRLSAVVLAIHHVTNSVMGTAPSSLARTIIEEMMAYVEIGTKVGSHVTALSASGGALIGFTRGAGLGLLLAHDPEAFKKWHSLTGGVQNRKLLLQTFGCEPFQVSACAVQQLGFGPDLAMGAALATGKLSPTHLKNDRTIQGWKAAFLWIEALREGRSYPADPAMRSVFPEIAPGVEGRPNNRILEILYTEVAKIRRQGSSWTWHLSNRSGGGESKAPSRTQSARP